MTARAIPLPPASLPDRAAAIADPHDEAAAQESRKRASRRRKLWINEGKVAATSYAINAFTLALFAATGTVHWSAALVYAVPGWGVCALVCWLIASGRSAAWKDPSVSALQSAAGMALCLLGMALYPQVNFLYALILFTLFLGATYRLSKTGTTLAWVVVIILFGVATLPGDRTFQVPHATRAEQAVAWFCFSATLARFTLVSMINTGHNHLLRHRGQQMRDTLAQIEHLANHDELTGALNRRSMLRLITEEMERSERSGRRFSVALFDLDRFKAINDTLGHLAGDRVLKTFSASMQAHQRTTDRFGRYGGEEFLLLMPDTPAAEAAQAVERLREHLSAADWNAVSPGLAVTFSAGLATHRPGETAEQLLARADCGLYGAKDAGRNCLRFG